MPGSIPFSRDFVFEYGRMEQVAPMVRRIVARNPSRFTWHGTGTYVIGEGNVAVIDPGPDLAVHVDALLAALDGENVTLKKLYREGRGRVRLQPANARLKPMLVDQGRLRIQGVVIGVLRKY